MELYDTYWNLWRSMRSRNPMYDRLPRSSPRPGEPLAFDWVAVGSGQNYREIVRLCPSLSDAQNDALTDLYETHVRER